MFGIDPGIIAVICGLVLFYMGYLKGKDVGQINGAGGMVDMLTQNGYLKIKSRTFDKNGDPIITYMKYDEE
tara:strand:+ start:417 stop:629 length:213 start_codon:yes stop_codon:yes gene_type:complete